MTRPGASEATANGDHRLFFAVWPDDEVRRALKTAAGGVDAFHGRGRRVAPAKYHLTLHFLGGWQDHPAHAIAAACEAAAQVDAATFRLVVDHAGSFRRARVGWLGTQGSPGLDALWAALGRRLDEAGVPRRPHDTFAPHVTVLRGFGGRIDGAAVPPVSWPVTDFVLVHSHAGHYDVIGRWPLRGAT